MMAKYHWRDHLAKKITVEEYYIHVHTVREGNMQFKIHYVIHNGYTRLEALPEYNHKLTDFEEWFKLRSDLNTRYDKPHWWKPIRGRRDKKIVDWAVGAIQKAYDQYYQENVERMRKS